MTWPTVIAGAWPRRVLRRLGRLSVRARLVLITVALLAVGLLLSNVVVLTTLRGPLLDRVDNQLRLNGALFSRIPPALFPSVNSGALRSLEDLEPGELRNLRNLDTDEIVDSFLGRDLISDLWVAYLAPDGSIRQTMHLQPGASGPDLPRLDTVAVAARGGRPFEVPGKDGSAEWRVLALPRAETATVGTSTPVPAGSSVAVAASLEEVDDTVSRVAGVCLLIGVIVLAALTAVGWFAVRGGLRPLRRVEETATAIAGGDLSRRVPDLAAPHTEVGRLSAALNGMLAQIEAGVAARAESEARMRRFVADVSHELRTPLFGIKGFTELYRMGGLPQPADVDRTMGRIEGESGRLTRLVEDLLLLARLDGRTDGGAFPLEVGPMDLRTLAADALHDLRGLDPSREVELTGPGGGPPATAPVTGDEARLRQVTSNLIGNAVAHTPTGTPVRIGVGTVGGEAVIEVADHGPGLAAEQTRRVFERFYRVDGSRSRAAGGGAGLGLAIVESLVTAHGGRVELDSALGAGTVVRVVLPVTATPDPAPATVTAWGRDRE